MQRYHKLSMKFIRNLCVMLLLACLLVPGKAWSNAVLLEAIDKEVVAALAPIAATTDGQRTKKAFDNSQHSEFIVMVMPVDLSSLYNNSDGVQQATLPASYIVDELVEQRAIYVTSRSDNIDLPVKYFDVNVLSNASDEYFNGNPKADIVLNKTVKTINRTVPLDVIVATPDGLNFKLKQCVSSRNAVSCDVEIQSDNIESGRLVVHGVYWNTDTWRPVKTALLAKKVIGATSEINVYPHNTVTLASLLIMGIHDEPQRQVSLGINYTFQNIEYFLNTKAISVLASTG